jgi:hypothetical protein
LRGGDPAEHAVCPGQERRPASGSHAASYAGASDPAADDAGERVPGASCGAWDRGRARHPACARTDRESLRRGRPCHLSSCPGVHSTSASRCAANGTQITDQDPGADLGEPFRAPVDGDKTLGIDGDDITGRSVSRSPPTSLREGDNGRSRSQTLAASSRGTITLCAVPAISMQRHVEGRCGTELGPLKVS